MLYLCGGDTMREILFKAKVVGSDKWATGDLTHDNEPDKVFIETMYPHWIMKEIVPRTVCQFTGLTDKNGNKIFENDILKTGLSETVVVWDKTKARFTLRSRSGYPMNALTEDIAKAREVVGNIFDNIGGI